MNHPSSPVPSTRVTEKVALTIAIAAVKVKSLCTKICPKDTSDNSMSATFSRAWVSAHPRLSALFTRLTQLTPLVRRGPNECEGEVSQILLQYRANL